MEERGGDVEDVFAALMHDATEAYLGDMPHPIKHRSALGAAFKEAEDRLEQAIRERFAIKPDVPEIKRADRALLATERRAFSGESWHWPELEGVEPLDLELTAWSPDEAADAFAQRYAELDAAALGVAALRMAGETVIRDRLPRRRVGDELAHARADARVVVERAEPDADRVGVAGVVAVDVRSAGAAEPLLAAHLRLPPTSASSPATMWNEPGAGCALAEAAAPLRR